jgi:predicted GNAT family acetyltransferase
MPILGAFTSARGLVARLPQQINQWNFAPQFATLEDVDAQLYDTATDFGPVARWVYRRNPVLFTVELTVLRATRWVTGPVLLSVADCDGALGAALQMPEEALLVSGLPPAMAKAAAAEVSTVRAALPAVRGTRSNATAFADAWCGVTGAEAVPSCVETLYRLDELDSRDTVVGVPRLAGPRDAELLVWWLDAFFVEAFGATPNPLASRDVLRNVYDCGGEVVLWTVNGAPVSMARVHAPVAGMSRIGPIYTPPESRGRGCGAAVTAAAVRHAHRRGARDVVLFADVANPGSNRIYRRLGFVPVAENVQYTFNTA